QGANLTVLDGADGLSSVIASLVGQGMALLDSIRAGGLTATSDAASPNTSVEKMPGSDSWEHVLSSRPSDAARR
ncbi:MAG TPA: hypothetical protein VE196_11585, partial [Pseudonocardiaceae bacterium]|nr:hypothetical protein [Pseudonocardiaceae bacterium]